MDMNRNNTIIALAMTVIVMLTAACGNADAKKDDKKKSEPAATEIKAKEINTEQFNTLVFDMTKEGTEYLGDKPAIVDFTAKWCGPCQRISPILDQLAKEYDGKIVIYKVDIEDSRN